MILHGRGDWEDGLLVPSFAIGLVFGGLIDESDRGSDTIY